MMLADTRNGRRRASNRVSVGGTEDGIVTKPMLVTVVGAAVGGALMISGHIMTGALAMLGGLLGGAILDKSPNS